MQLFKIGLILTSLTLGSTQAQANVVTSAPQPPAGTVQTGTQWITTPDGCSYSRTQAPGYPVQWVLILNPHHIGRPNAHLKCAPILRG